jgi:hypothetical protein
MGEQRMTLYLKGGGQKIAVLKVLGKGMMKR